MSAAAVPEVSSAEQSDANIRAATRLGAPFKVFAGEVSSFRVGSEAELHRRRMALRPSRNRVLYCQAATGTRWSSMNRNCTERFRGRC
jgi:hypothetical protein